LGQEFDEALYAFLPRTQLQDTVLDTTNICISKIRAGHKEELHNLYSSPDIIRKVKSRRMRWAGHMARMGEERKGYTVLVGKPEGRRPPGRPRRRWEDGVRMDLREIG
jgi:hypothetical protein